MNRTESCGMLVNKSSWRLVCEHSIYNFLMSYVLLQVEFLKLVCLVHIFISFFYQNKNIEMTVLVKWEQEHLCLGHVNSCKTMVCALPLCLHLFNYIIVTNIPFCLSVPCVLFGVKSFWGRGQYIPSLKLASIVVWIVVLGLTF